MNQATLVRTPEPSYLLGAMLSDGIAQDKAIAITEAYASVKPKLNESDIGKWLWQLLDRLGTVGQYPDTAVAALAYQSEHQASRYRSLANAAGWKA